jgi:SHS2 domain-containing protein
MKKNNVQRFRFLEHTADIKFQAFGKTLEEAFANSALALKETMTSDKVKEKIKEEMFVFADGRGAEGALHDFLEEFLFLFETKGFLLGKILKIRVMEDDGEYAIDCTVLGDKAENYKISDHVKAVTYNDMLVKKEKNSWLTQVVLDV